MFSTRRLSEILAILFLVSVAIPTRAQAPAEAHHGRGRIVVLMVWDGLRPDFVTQRDTPNLFRLAREGVRFDKHHSIFPTLTMVNATALSTGAPPGVNGLVGNNFYLEPSKETPKGQIVGAEGAKAILNLNGAAEFKGRLIGLDTITQEVAREGGYVAVIGKQGPTSVFDNRVATIVDGKDIVGEPHKDYLFASEDLVATSGNDENKITVPPESKSAVTDEQQDLYFARLTVEDAIPAAKRAADAGQPALVVFWQHNPDLTQHVAGLGTLPAMEALSLCDNNLTRVRAAIDALGIADKTDLIVVSDHGFATIKFRVVLSEMLVAAGIKKSHDSTDVVVVPNGGADLVYLSPTDFPAPEQRRAVLQKIVNFAEAQEWCGPIFSRDPATTTAPDETSGRRRHQRAPKPYLGWIDGTFSQRVVGLYNPARSPDLVISFREEPDADNKHLTGASNPAFLIGQIGQVSTPNKSAELIHPVKGVVYADTGTGQTFTTGMGMHGAAGEREIHNFCAATGPDFRRGFVDSNPTADTDVAPTITQILGTLPNIGPGGVAPAGRAMTEALTGGSRSAGGSHTQAMTANLTLQGVEAVTTIHVTWIGDEPYLDSSSVEHKPLGSSP
jgi:arylsulfatase A-like enzyme